MGLRGLVMNVHARAVALALAIAVLTVAVYNLESKVKSLEKLTAGHGKWLQEHHFELRELREPPGDDGPYRTRLKVLPDGEPPVPEFGPRICADCRFLNAGKNNNGPICMARPDKNGGGYQFCGAVNEKHDCDLYRPKSRKPPPDPPRELHARFKRERASENESVP